MRLLGTAAGWGGNPASDALYAGVVPATNDAKVVHRLTVRDVPVDGFWSVSVYNKDGFFEKNPRNAYSVNNVSVKRSPDGSVTVQFGGCSDDTINCLPVTPGWNYLVRMYRPSKAILDKSWTFPEAKPSTTLDQPARRSGASALRVVCSAATFLRTNQSSAST